MRRVLCLLLMMTVLLALPITALAKDDTQRDTYPDAQKNVNDALPTPNAIIADPSYTKGMTEIESFVITDLGTDYARFEVEFFSGFDMFFGSYILDEVGIYIADPSIETPKRIVFYTDGKVSSIWLTAGMRINGLTPGVDYKAQAFFVRNGNEGKSRIVNFRTTGGPPAASSIAIDPSSLSLAVNESKVLKTILTPSNATADIDFESSDENVATVNKNGVVKGISGGNATITATTFNGKNARCTVDVTDEPNGISLVPATVILRPGGSKKLQVTLIPANAQTTITWKSGNTKIASVSDGTITAKSAGSTMITATTNNGKSAKCSVKVEPILLKSAKIKPAKPSVAIGGTIDFTAIVFPTNATNKKVTWTSSKPAVAKINKTTGKLSALKNGKTVVKVIAKDSGKAIASTTVTVKKPVKTTGISVSPSKEQTLEIGKEKIFKAIIKPANASNKDIKWTSSKKSVATISEKGVLTAKKAGTTYVTATTKDTRKVSKNVKVTIITPKPTSVDINRTSLAITVGESQKLSAVILPKGANPSLVWDSHDPSVATVNHKGEVCGKKAGETKITAYTANKKRDTIPVKVRPKSTKKQYTVVFKSGFAEVNREFKFSYEDSYFLETSAKLNKKLARASMSLAADAYAKQGVYDKCLLTDMGFTVMAVKNYSRKATKENNNFVAYKIVCKVIKVNGKKFDLWGLFVRGTPGSAEWYSNFDPGSGDMHHGFDTAAREVYEDFNKLVSTSSRPTKMWIAGHSRGAAVANIVAKKMSLQVNVDSGTIYAYTFACPNVVRNSNDYEAFIHNFNNFGDLVTQVPPKVEWGYHQFGLEYGLGRSDGNAVEKRFTNLWGIEFEGGDLRKRPDQIDEAMEALTVIFPKPPLKGSKSERVFRSLGGIIAGDFNIRSRDDLRSFFDVLIIGHEANKYKLRMAIDDFVSFLHLDLTNGFAAIKHNHSQELYLAWMDYLVETSK